MRRRKFRVQSHLSEGLDEMEWVRELKPELSFYGEGYDEYHMFGDTVPTVRLTASILRRKRYS